MFQERRFYVERVDDSEQTVAYAVAMQRYLLLVGLALALAGCAHGPYESVFEDGGYRLTPHEFNTSASGMDICPGELFGYASQGAATCSSAPQQCRADTTTSRFNCFCVARSDAGTGPGLWSCR